MPKPNRRTVILVSVAVLLIIAAYMCRVFKMPVRTSISLMLGLIRSAIYIGLFAVWGFSVRRRIIQKQTRRYMTAIAVLIEFWLAIRTVKFFLVNDADISRQIWYLYYLPMLFIPLLALFISMSIGKPETFSLPKWTAVLYAVTALLVILVLTNDMHQIVFSFHNVPWSDHDNDYEFGYWAAIIWEYLCAASSMLILLVKCRVPSSRRMIWLPFIPIAAASAYGIVYFLGFPWLRIVFGDMTVTQCLLYAVTLECCIQCGLIQSNTHYTELFRVSTVRARITDRDYSVLLLSESSDEYPEEMMRRTENGPVLLENGIRLSGAPIKKGHVIWEDDVSVLAGLKNRLEDTGEYLQSQNYALAEELKTRLKLRHLVEQNQLYNKMQIQTSSQVALLSDLVQKFEKADKKETESSLLCRISLLGAYLKRRNNLIFLSEEQGELPGRELYHCLQESIQNLSLFGIPASQLFEADGDFPFGDIMLMYDVFENILEHSVQNLSELFVSISGRDGRMVMSVRLCCPDDLSDLGRDGLSVKCEEPGEWLAVFSTPEAPEALQTGGEKQ